MRTIYSTEKLSIDGVQVLGIDKLSAIKRQWVVENRRRLLTNCTLPENVSAKIFATFDDKPKRQVYFMIRGRSYFLDFFFPKRMLAVEIDGSVHKYNKEHDRRRDADFRSIGIRTVRIKNKDVMQGKLYEVLFKKLFK